MAKRKSYAEVSAENVVVETDNQDIVTETVIPVPNRMIKSVWPTTRKVTVKSYGDDVVLVFSPGEVMSVTQEVYNQLISQTKEINGCCGGVGKRIINLFENV